MALRKGVCYRSLARPYTRTSKVKSKNYIKATTPSKVMRYDMGDTKREFKWRVNLFSRDNVQIRHNAIESARQVVNRRLHERLGVKNYHLKIMIYPHHYLRENKMLVGAGADRMQSGMAKSFGKVMGSAAQVKKGGVIFSVGVDDNGLEIVKQSLKLAGPRLPCSTGVEVNLNEN